jgi:nitroreductase/NAD-dependent dihydropyrimidine dehydrogenase PreA subunit
MITVNRETCTKCGLCAKVCPDNFIYFKANNYPRPIPGFDLLCIKCGHCVGVCPTASLTHQAVPVEKCPAIKPELRINAEQCEQFIRARRSIREYKNEAVPRELIERLIDIAHYAPTGHNGQEVEWLVVDKKETLLEIEKAGIGWMREMITRQPQMAEMMDFKARVVHQEKNLNTFLRGAPVLVCAIGDKTNPMTATDCVIAMTTLELAATSLGLGGCWAGFISFMAASYPPVQSILNIPAGKAGYGFMMLGYPQYRYARLIARQPAPIIWHQ